MNTRRAVKRRAFSIAAVMAAFALGAPGPARSTGANDDAAAAVERVLAAFRAGWTPTKEHMRRADDTGWKLRMETLGALVRLGEDAVLPLTGALDDPQPDVRVLAAQALSYLADGRASARLEETLAGDAEAAARLYAADALGAAGGLRPSPLLEKAESSDANRDVRSHVRFALERGGRPLDDAVRAPLRTLDPERLDAARVGQPAPDFSLTDALGKAYRLADFRDKRAVVLVFIYGDT